jgi:hypothetical protein
MVRYHSVQKVFVYFLALSFLFFTVQFPRTAAAGQGEGSPGVGEMVSRGEVEFEVTNDRWKAVEPSHFPIIPGVRVRTKAGEALIILPGGTRIQVGENSVFSLGERNLFHLEQGRLSFRIAADSGMLFTVGGLSIGKGHTLQASTSEKPEASTGEQAVSSIAIRPDGSLHIKGIEGTVTVKDEKNQVLAAVSSGESVTVPSTAASESQGAVLAQVGEIPEEWLETDPSGISRAGWIAAGLCGTAFVVGIALLAGGGGGSGSSDGGAGGGGPDFEPLCP